jgi:hypothetical protein
LTIRRAGVGVGAGDPIGAQHHKDGRRGAVSASVANGFQNVRLTSFLWKEWKSGFLWETVLSANNGGPLEAWKQILNMLGAKNYFRKNCPGSIYGGNSSILPRLAQGPIKTGVW